MSSELNQRWADFLVKTGNHFHVSANLEFLLFVMGLQELGQGFRAYSKQEKTDIISLARCRLLTMSGHLQQNGTDSEGWPLFEVLKDENEMLPSERDGLMRENLMLYFDNHLFNNK